MTLADPRLIGLTPELRNSEQSSELRRRVQVLERSGWPGSAQPVTGGGGGSGSGLLIEDTPTVDLELTGGTLSANATIGVYDVRDYGGDENIDILGALNAAQSAMPSYGGVLWVPLNRVNISDTFVVTKPIKFRCLGPGFYSRQASSPTYNPQTLITWTGGASDTMFELDSIAGAEFSDFSVNGGSGNLLLRVFDLLEVQGSTFKRIVVRKLAVGGVAFRLRTPLAADIPGGEEHAHNTQDNRFEQLHLDAPRAFSMFGDGGANPTSVGTKANVCHNTFSHVTCVYGAGGAAESTTGDEDAIVIHDGDNNQFYHLRCYKVAGTGYGVNFGGAARQNYFYHLAPGENGVLVESPITGSQAGQANAIYGYDRSNGEAAPTIQTNALLTWTEEGGLSEGWGVNAATAAAMDTDYDGTYRFGSATGTSIAAHAPVSDNHASLDALGTTSGGTQVWGRVQSDKAGVVRVGSWSAHNVSFIRGATEVFGFNTSGHAQFASGKRLGFNVDPSAALHFAAGTTAADGIQFGTDLNAYRSAAGTFKLSSAAAADVTFDIAQGGTSLYQLMALGTNQKFRLQDGTRQYIRIDRTTGLLEFPFMAVDNGEAAGAISMAPGSTWDVSAGAAGRFTFLKMHAPGFAGGVNDRGGGVTDDVTASDAPNDPASATLSWWQPHLTSYTFASKGTLTAHYIGVNLNKPTGATFPDTYNEGRCRDGFMTITNKGSNAAVIESGVEVIATGDGGPARARVQIVALDDANLHSAYTSSVFGTGSRYIHQGSIGLDFQAGGAGYVGTGIVFQGGGASSETSAPSAYKRAVVLRNRAGTMDLFCLDGAGNIGVRRSTNQADGTTLSAALTVGWTSAGAESTVAADGIMWGDDVVLYRGNADVLVTDDQFNALRYVVSGTAGAGFVQFSNEQSSDPAAPSANQARVFTKDNGAGKTQLCVRFNTGATQVIATEP